MAILQEPNAVFYHPLDDRTEFLQTQAWLGDGTFPVGKVSDALGPVFGDSLEAFGAESEFNSAGDSQYMTVAILDTSSFVVAYADWTDAGHGTAKVGAVSGTDITWGAEAEFAGAGSVSYISAATLSATAFVVAYSDGADSSHGKAKVGTVSGMDITFGTETKFNAANTPYNSVAILGSTKFVVAYRDQTDGHGKARVGMVSGTDVTFGAVTEFLGVGTPSTGATKISVAALSATTVVVAYKDEADSDHGTAKVGTVSGTDITFGAESEFIASVAGPGQTSTVALSATVFVVAYRDVSGSNFGTAQVGLISGTDITFGAKYTFTGSSGDYISASALGASGFVVAYRDTSAGAIGGAKVGTVSGTTITFGAGVNFLNTNAQWIVAATVNSAKFVVVYADTDDSERGTAKVGALSTSPSLLVGQNVGFGVDAEFLTAGIAETTVVTLSASSFVVVYKRTDSGRGQAKVGTVSGTDITFGAATYLHVAPTTVSLISAAVLDSARFVVAYRDVDNNRGEAIVGTVSGTDITFGAVVNFNIATQTDYLSVAALSSTKIVVAYATTGGVANAKAATVTGSAIAFGVLKEFDASTTTSDISAVALSATVFVLMYNGAGGAGKAKVGTVSALDITFGAEATFLAGAVGAISAATLSATKFVVAYEDNADSGHGTAKVGTVSGADVTFGAEAEFNTAGGDVSVAALSATKFVVAYTDSAPHGNSNIGTVSGTDIAFGPPTEFLSVSTASYNAVSALSATKFVVAYRDEADSDHGTAKVAAITDAYPTAVGATRLAFSAWSKSS